MSNWPGLCFLFNIPFIISRWVIICNNHFDYWIHSDCYFFVTTFWPSHYTISFRCAICMDRGRCLFLKNGDKYAYSQHYVLHKRIPFLATHVIKGIPYLLYSGCSLSCLAKKFILSWLIYPSIRLMDAISFKQEIGNVLEEWQNNQKWHISIDWYISQTNVGFYGACTFLLNLEIMGEYSCL